MTPAFFVNGTVGIGKSTLLDHLADLWEARGQPFSVIDLDHLQRTWPPPDDDPFNLALVLANLAALRRNDRTPTGRAVAVAGVLERAEDRPAYEQALGSPVVVVRLVADGDVVADRLRHRHQGPHETERLAWHLHRAEELAAVLDRAGADDHVVDVTRLEPREVASAVLGLVPRER